jgi:2-haloacid dehalogenase
MLTTQNGRFSIVFDIGGVLIDWDPRYLYSKLFAGDVAAMERFLVETRFHEWNARQDAGRSFSAAVAEQVERFPAYADFIRAYDSRWEESLGAPDWQAVAILEALQQAGYRLYALSNWSAEKFPLIRRKYPFFDWFESIVLSGEVQLIKPDPRIFTVFLERICRAPEQCLFIDDAPANISTAQQLGFHTIHFQSSEQLAAGLRRLQILPLDWQPARG